MVNQINELNSTTANGTGKKPGSTDAVAADSSSAKETATPANRSDVELSSQAQHLNQLEAQLARLPEVDQERVAALRDAITNGQFEIDSFSLAQDIINFEFN